MTGKFKIYGLVCPITNKIRYVGKSASFKTRYKQHCEDVGEETYKKKWIKKLRERNILPLLIILDSATTEIDARLLENENCVKHIKTIYNIFMPNKNAPTVSDFRKQNNIEFDFEFDKMEMDSDKYNKS